MSVGTPESFVVGYVGPNFAFATVKESLGSQFDAICIPPESATVHEFLPLLDGLVEASTRIPLDAIALSAAPRLRIISVAGTGAAHVDVEAARKLHVKVRTLVEDPELLEVLEPTSEYTWALILSLARRVHEGWNHVLDGGWERELFPGKPLFGQKLGVVGLGRLGRKVARVGIAFGMDVCAYDVRSDQNWPDSVTAASLESVFETSNYISLHVPLSATTEGMIDQALISRMHPDALLINTSRGAIVDEVALCEAIDSGAIGGAALDVLSQEPPGLDHPLVKLARRDHRVLITPHLGGFVPEAVKRACRRAAEKVRLELTEETTQC